MQKFCFVCVMLYGKAHKQAMGEVMSHLAAAIMLAEIYLGGSSLAQLRKHVAEERHRYGWEHLSCDEGIVAESALYRFATFVEKEG